MERGTLYYAKRLNDEFPRKDITPRKKIMRPIEEITVDEEARAVFKMKRNKGVEDLMVFPVELWKECNQYGTLWLTVLLKKLLKGDPMLSSMRNSYSLPFYKNKRYSRDCGNYRGITLMSHTIKVFERVVESRLRNIISINENQCGFVLHMIFIDLEKAFDQVPRELIYETLRYHEIPQKYVDCGISQRHVPIVTPPNKFDVLQE